MRQVFVHIDRLVLTGVRHGDRRAVAEGLQHGLQHALEEHQAAAGLATLGHQSRLRVRGVDVMHGAGARALGDRVGQGIGREIGT